MAKEHDDNLSSSICVATSAVCIYHSS